jgi:biotin carboxyl carrier protein
MSDPLRGHAGVSAAELADVLGLIADSDITELDITLGSTRLSLRRTAGQAPVGSAMPDAAALESPAVVIPAPLVGIFRLAVQAGDEVEAGQAIGAVEALGLPTPVEAAQPGIVEDVLVADGTPVEYGQPLLVLRRSAS